MLKCYTTGLLYPFIGCICLLPLKLVSVDGDKVLSCLETERSFLLEIQQLPLVLFATQCGEAEENP